MLYQPSLLCHLFIGTMTNYHKHSSLNQYKFITLQLIGSECDQGLTGAGRVDILSGSSGRICFIAFSSIEIYPHF